MKKSELKLLIREAIQELNEENEILRAEELAKASMFKFKKAIEPILNNWKKDGYLDSYKSRISPYNGGFNIIWDFNVNKDKFNYKKFRDNKDLPKLYYMFLGNSFNIWIQPATFMGAHFDKGESSRIEGRSFNIDERYVSFREDVKNKNDIKAAFKKYDALNLKEVEEFKKIKV